MGRSLAYWRFIFLLWLVEFELSYSLDRFDRHQLRNRNQDRNPRVQRPQKSRKNDLDLGYNV
jgi:hypothetical protein